MCALLPFEATQKARWHASFPPGVDGRHSACRNGGTRKCDLACGRYKVNPRLSSTMLTGFLSTMTPVSMEWRTVWVHECVHPCAHSCAHLPACLRACLPECVSACVRPLHASTVRKVCARRPGSHRTTCVSPPVRSRNLLRLLLGRIGPAPFRPASMFSHQLLLHAGLGSRLHYRLLQRAWV